MGEGRGRGGGGGGGAVLGGGGGGGGGGCPDIEWREWSRGYLGYEILVPSFNPGRVVQLIKYNQTCFMLV